MPDSAYSLRPMRRADLPMLAEWLTTPGLRRWWGDPDRKLALVTDDLDDPAMDQQIVSLDGLPFGYLQSCPCAARGAPQFRDMPSGTRAVDTCIGVQHLLGQGHGAALLRLYARTLLAGGAARVVTDPDPANDRAVRAYRRAGFRDLYIRPGEAGAPVIVMRFDPDIPSSV